jgi:amino acid transporter
MRQVLCEINRPRKTLVKGIIIAVAIVCVLYMLVNISYVCLAFTIYFPISYYACCLCPLPIQPELED